MWGLPGWRFSCIFSPVNRYLFLRGKWDRCNVGEVSWWEIWRLHLHFERLVRPFAWIFISKLGSQRWVFVHAKEFNKRIAPFQRVGISIDLYEVGINFVVGVYDFALPIHHHWSATCQAAIHCLVARSLAVYCLVNFIYHSNVETLDLFSNHLSTLFNLQNGISNILGQSTCKKCLVTPLIGLLYYVGRLQVILPCVRDVVVVFIYRIFLNVANHSHHFFSFVLRKRVWTSRSLVSHVVIITTILGILLILVGDVGSCF